MDLELEDHENVSVRDEDKTRRFVALGAGPRIDDLGTGADTESSPLPAPSVTPFASPLPGEGVRAPTPPLPPLPTKQGGTPESTMSHDPPKTPPGANPSASPVEVSSPTIVVNEIVHVPTPSRREATVMVKRPTRGEPREEPRHRSPLGWALGVAVVLVASALAYVGAKRALENERREEQIQQRIDEVRRQQTE